MLERFFRRTDAWLPTAAFLALLFTPGCAYMTTAAPDSVAGYVDYMNRAVQADAAAWRTMKTRAEHEYQTSRSLASQLRAGLLLTTPNPAPDDVKEDMQRGIQLLQDAVASDDPRLSTDVRALVNIRLKELAARQALHQELDTKEKALEETAAKLDDTEGKLNELLNIENSMENNRQQNEGRQR